MRAVTSHLDSSALSIHAEMVRPVDEGRRERRSGGPDQAVRHGRRRRTEGSGRPVHHLLRSRTQAGLPGYGPPGSDRTGEPAGARYSGTAHLLAPGRSRLPDRVPDRGRSNRGERKGCALGLLGCPRHRFLRQVGRPLSAQFGLSGGIRRARLGGDPAGALPGKLRKTGSHGGGAISLSPGGAIFLSPTGRGGFLAACSFGGGHSCPPFFDAPGCKTLRGVGTPSPQDPPVGDKKVAAPRDSKVAPLNLHPGSVFDGLSR